MNDDLAELEREMVAEREAAARVMWLAVDAYNAALDRLAELNGPTWTGSELDAYDVAEAAVCDALEQVEAWERFPPL
jgi:hypothetical protein